MDDCIYTERLTSNKTETLFLALTLLFLLLLTWQLNSASFDLLSAIFLSIFIIFLFYSLNYRALKIRLTSKSLQLKFGLFTWTVPMESIAECRLDQIPWLMRMGGAGIHFMNIGGRYRASFNFLEYPRVVCSFKRKIGPIRDLSFSTRQPDEIIRLVQEAISASR
jgi:hypothetical protein